MYHYYYVTHDVHTNIIIVMEWICHTVVSVRHVSPANLPLDVEIGKRPIACCDHRPCPQCYQ